MDESVKRDPVVWIMFGFALLLTVLNLAGAAVVARSGHIELLFAALVLTALFAVAGAVLGLMRNLRSARAIKRRSV